MVSSQGSPFALTIPRFPLNSAVVRPFSKKLPYTSALLSLTLHNMTILTYSCDIELIFAGLWVGISSVRVKRGEKGKKFIYSINWVLLKNSPDFICQWFMHN